MKFDINDSDAAMLPLYLFAGSIIIEFVHKKGKLVVINAVRA
jgi:hypothetical protein